MSDHFDTIRADTLLFVLSAFAEPEPDPRKARDDRITQLWAGPMTAEEIGQVMGMKANNVRAVAYRLWLPPRKGNTRHSAPFLPSEPIRRLTPQRATVLARGWRRYSLHQRCRGSFQTERHT